MGDASTDIPIRIVKATYEPGEGRRLLNGDWTNSVASRIPFTRDVTPILRALLIAQATSYESAEKSDTSALSSKSAVANEDDNKEEGRKCGVDADEMKRARTKRVSKTALKETSPIRKNSYPIMDGKSMNAFFGDPCPGTTKRLIVHYVFSDEENDATNNNGKRRKRQEQSSLLCRSIFAEHERVLLKRRITHYQHRSNRLETKKGGPANAANGHIDQDQQHDHSSTEEDDWVDSSSPILDTNCSNVFLKHEENVIHEVKSEQQEKSKKNNDLSQPEANSKVTEEQEARNSVVSSSPAKKWRLRSATSEITLPMVLPYLEVRQRAQSQLVCKCWRFVVSEWGVAQTVDVSDPNLPHFTRSFLRGIVSQSYSSLQRLFLNDFVKLMPEDLHPALPHLRKLRTLDVSRCHQLGDQTLLLISNTISTTLEVLDIKGLRLVTDIGICAICRSCQKLRVLDVSDVLFTDDSAMEIGHNLHRLEALFMKDNFHVTNRSIDIITASCSQLTQLTLWGSTKLRHWSHCSAASGQNDEDALDDETNSFFNTSNKMEILSQTVLTSSEAGPLPMENSNAPLVGVACHDCNKLISLNLWGCHNLADDTAVAMQNLHCLRSLIVSECHQLTDKFVIKVAQVVPQVQHFHLRYVRKISNASIEAISANMHNLYSLDLSFCSKVTQSSLCTLIERRGYTLSELRLYSCRQLGQLQQEQQPGQRTSPQQQRFVGGHNSGVTRNGLMSLIRAIQTSGTENCLCILDVRECHKARRGVVADHFFGENTSFVNGMTCLGFKQKLGGFFVRPAKWNKCVKDRLVSQIQ